MIRQPITLTFPKPRRCYACMALKWAAVMMILSGALLISRIF